MSWIFNKYCSFTRKCSCMFYRNNMENKIIKTIALLVLLAFPTSGQNSPEDLNSKYAESVTADTQHGRTVPHSGRIQGSPGEWGLTCNKGDRGLPGLKGESGSDGIVDYERIYEAINETIRRGA